MIGIIFEFSGELIEVRINVNQVLFRKKEFGSQFATIDNLKLDYYGVCKEFPDLEDNDNWKDEAINRFKEKIKSMDSEKEKTEYIIKDLSKFGYIPKYFQQQGHRPKRIE